jgi:hypothetical protein
MKRLGKTKWVVLAVALLVVIGAGVTLAIITNATGSLTNTFKPGNIDTEIKEDYPDTVGGKAPYVENTGKNDCLVRMSVYVSPENAGAVLAGLENNADWYDGGDGFWYYDGVLPAGSGSRTEYLFTQVLVPGQSAGTDAETAKKLWADFLAEYPDFSVTLYHEACQVTNGDVSALVNGSYDRDGAKAVWDIFDSAK